MTVISNQPSGSAIPFTITEQTGDKRTITLTERALPYRPIEFGGEQRAEFTAYPGNPKRTLQVFGAEELPTEIKGYWKDRFLGTAPNAASENVIAYYQQNGLLTTVSTAMDLATLIDDVRKKGQEVVVQWGPVVRRGLLKRFTFSPHNLHDVEWTIRFEWEDQNDPDSPAVIAKDTDNAQTQGSLSAAVQNLKNTIATATNTAADQIGTYTSQIAVLENLSNEFSDTTSNVLDTAMPIVDQQRRLAGILGDISNNVDTMVDTIDATPSAVLAVPDYPGGPLEGPALAVEAMNRALMSSLRDMQFAAITAQFSILKSVNPNILTVFTARQDTDLRDVSTTFYNTQDEWRSIMVFNNLTTSKLNSGDTVFVPQLNRPLDGSQ